MVVGSAVVDVLWCSLADEALQFVCFAVALVAVHAFSTKEDVGVFSSGEAVWWGDGIVSVVVLVSCFKISEICVFLVGMHGFLDPVFWAWCAPGLCFLV